MLTGNIDVVLKACKAMGARGIMLLLEDQPNNGSAVVHIIFPGVEMKFIEAKIVSGNREDCVFFRDPKS